MASFTKLLMTKSATFPTSTMIVGGGDTTKVKGPLVELKHLSETFTNAKLMITCKILW